MEDLLRPVNQADLTNRDSPGVIDTVRSIPSGGEISIRGRLHRGELLAIRGWAFRAEDRRAYDRIEVRAGQVVVPASTDLQRPDVVAILGLGKDVRPGYLAIVPTDEFPFGPVVVTVAGILSDGMPATIGRRILTVSSPKQLPRRVEGTFSSRVIIDPLSIIDVGGVGVLDVRGWALGYNGNPGRGVTVSIGGRIYPALYGYPRPDVVSALGLGPEANACGFRARIGCDDVFEQCELVAQLECGTERFDSSPLIVPPGHRRMVLPGTSEPIGSIDQIAMARDDHYQVESRLAVRVGESFVLRGWAASETGSLNKLVVLFDGMHRTLIHERHEREDVAFATGHKDAGFIVNVTVPEVDPGFHLVEVFAVDENGEWKPTAARSMIEVVAPLL